MVSNWMKICDGIEIRYLFLDENAFHNGKLKIIQLQSVGFSVKLLGYCDIFNLF